MKKINKQKGFTLIELMVVIAVISLVSSIITYSTSEAKVKAEDSKMIQEAQQVEKAIQLYKENNDGKVPGAVIFAGGEGVMGKMYKESDPEYTVAMNELVAEKVYPKIPRSSSGNSYAYMVSLDGESAVFSAVLKKPASGGSGGSSSKNSCDIVDGDVSYSNCTPVFSGADCSSAQYDNETQKCFAIESYCFWKNKCFSVGSSKDPNSFPNEMCLGQDFNEPSICDPSYVPSGRVERGTETPPPQPPGFTEQDEACEPSYPYLCGYIPDSGPVTYVCDFDGVAPVCSGGSNNDFCACI